MAVTSEDDDGDRSSGAETSTRKGKTGGGKGSGSSSGKGSVKGQGTKRPSSDSTEKPSKRREVEN